jgi:hypothetical protein
MDLSDVTVHINDESSSDSENGKNEEVPYTEKVKSYEKILDEFDFGLKEMKGEFTNLAETYLFCSDLRLQIKDQM